MVLSLTVEKVSMIDCVNIDSFKDLRKNDCEKQNLGRLEYYNFKTRFLMECPISSLK